MSLVTPTHAIPYLTPGDRMAAIPAVDKAQALRIEHLLEVANIPPGNPNLNAVLTRLSQLEAQREDTGWVNCPLVSGTTQQGSSLPQVRRIGKMVQMRHGVSGDGKAAASASNVCTVPVGFRPSDWQYFVVASADARYPGKIVVKSTGTVELTVGTNASSYFIFDVAHWYID